MRKMLRVLGIMVICLLFVDRIPIKRGISIEEVNKKIKKNDTYICEQTATTGPTWLIYKHNDKKQGVYLEGKLPFDDINKNSFFYSAHNRFLICGDKIGIVIIDQEGNIEKFYGDDMEEVKNKIQNSEKKYESYEIIYVKQWDIIRPINRGSVFRLWAPKNYLSIFDYVN